MDYEKKYKDLVNAVMELQKANPSDEGIQNWVNDNFPELAESKDERIKRNIIAALKGEGYYDCDLTNECIAWVEKQGKQKPADMVNPKDYSSIDPHFFKTDWSEGDEMLCQCLIEDQEEALDDVCNDKCGHSEIISDLKGMYRERIDWLKSLKERMEGE